MRTNVGFDNLNHDLIDNIISSLYDLDTLSAVIRTNKTCYDVFSVRPKSIVRAVVHNIVGPALPAAMRLVLLQDLLDAPDNVPLEANVNVNDFSRDTAEELARNAKAVQGLEDLFSWRQKDRTSPTSKLSPLESARFHNAVYRLWWFTDLLAAKFQQYEDEDLGETADWGRFLSVYTVDELFEIQRVRLFLHETVKWADHVSCGGNGLRYPDFYDGRCQLMLGPSYILKCYQQRDMYGADDDGAEFTDAFTDLMTARNILEADHTTMLGTAILDEVIGNQDACHRCQTVHGLNLYGSSTWPLLEGHLNLLGICAQLDGNLARNVPEVELLSTSIRGTDGVFTTHNYVALVEEMFDFEADPQGVWSKDEMYCLDCMRELFKQRLRRWWLAKKQELHIAIREDCWYGYNCRTQTHKLDHAVRLNHLCDPTRGDAPK